MIWTGPHANPTAEHDRLSHLLHQEDRVWLRRMADVLPWGWVVNGMDVPRRGAVVASGGYPGGVRLIVAPEGPGAASRAAQ